MRRHVPIVGTYSVLNPGTASSISDKSGVKHPRGLNQLQSARLLSPLAGAAMMQAPRLPSDFSHSSPIPKASSRNHLAPGPAESHKHPPSRGTLPFIEADL